MLPPYRYWPITERPRFRWPQSKRLACFVGLNIEHFWPGKVATSRTMVTAQLPVDPLNHGWRDYGPRVGVWRIVDLLDELRIPASAIVNADALAEYPEVIRAGLARDWGWVAHGRTNSALWTGFESGEEQRMLKGIVADFDAALGRRPMGWLGPALTETAQTLPLLADLGFTYTMDWTADDQPFPVEVAGARFVSVPYSNELNDIPAFIDQGLSGPDFGQAIVDQFEVLYREADRWPGGVMAIPIHPFLVGQPFRFRHFEQALRHIRDHDDVWFCTSDDIAAWYLEHAYDEAVAALSRRSAPPAAEAGS